MNQWETLYQQAYRRGLQKIADLKGVACAFHSVIDGILRITPAILDTLFANQPHLKAAAKRYAQGEIPQEILSPDDFICGLFYSLSRGAACQRMIRAEATYQWALDTFGPGQLRLGGTSANMARSLAPLGIPVLLYANPLTVELANLMGDDPRLQVLVKENQAFTLKHPKTAAREQGIFAIHWILEYEADFAYPLDDLLVQPGRANRFIPSWNPRNNQFKMDPDFAEGFLSMADSFQHFLFSGFHILSDAYPDGATCADVVQPLGAFLSAVQRRAPELRIHLEMASIASPCVRQAMLTHVFPFIHSIGLNETELPLLLESLGETSRLAAIKQHPSILTFADAAAALMRRTGLRRVHFHNLGYYLCLETQPWGTQEDSRNALLFAAIMAAARAQNGLFSSLSDIEAGLQTPLDERGLRCLREAAESLEQASVWESGMGMWEDLFFTLIPSKFVTFPVFTVGLGDTISAGAFLTE